MEDIKARLNNFGLDDKTAEIYLILVEFGPSGIMQITRRAKLGRNVAYRLLGELVNQQLVSVSQKSFGSEYAATGPEALEAKVEITKSKAASMSADLNIVAAQLNALSGQNRSKILHFHGMEGLKQVNWNMTKADGEYRVFEQSHLDEHLDAAFSEKLRQKYVENDLTSYDLTNKTVVESAFPSGNLEYWSTKSLYRHIPESVLKIQYEMFIYDETVTLLSYGGQDEPHAIEIHNLRLAEMQRQIFDVIWNHVAIDFVTDQRTGLRTLPQGHKP